MAIATAGMNTTERTLVVARYPGFIVQVAYRKPEEAAAAAAELRGALGLVDVQVDTVPHYRGRRVTRVIL
jgi:hypothetical protein